MASHIPSSSPRTSPEIQVEDPRFSPSRSRTSSMEDRVASAESIPKPRLPTKMERLMDVLGLSQLRSRDSDVRQKPFGGRKATSAKSDGPRFPKLRAMLNFFIGLFTCFQLGSRSARVGTPQGTRAGSPLLTLNDTMVSGTAKDGYGRQTEREQLETYVERVQQLDELPSRHRRRLNYHGAFYAVHDILGHYSDNPARVLSSKDQKKLNAAFVKMDEAVLAHQPLHKPLDTNPTESMVSDPDVFQESSRGTDLVGRGFMRLNVRRLDSDYQKKVVTIAGDRNKLAKYGEYKAEIEKILRSYAGDMTKELGEGQQKRLETLFATMDNLVGMPSYEDGKPLDSSGSLASLDQ